MKLLFTFAVLFGLAVPPTFSQSADKAELAQQLAEIKKQRSANIKQRNAIFAELKQKPASLQTRAKSDAAWKAYEELRKSHPKVVEALQSVEDAKSALDALIDKHIDQDADAAKLLTISRAAPARQQDLEFQIAVLDFKLSHPLSPWQRELDQDPEIQKLRDSTSTAKDRRAAVLAYRKSRQEKLSTLEDAKPLIAERDKLKSDVETTRTEMAAALTELAKVRSSITAKPTPEIEAAVKAHAAAAKGVDAAYKSEDLVTTYEDYRKLFRAYSEGLDKQMESDARVIELDKQRKELEAKITELEAKLKEGSK